MRRHHWGMLGSAHSDGKLHPANNYRARSFPARQLISMLINFHACSFPAGQLFHVHFFLQLKENKKTFTKQ
jgi:hypothetical protein